MDQLELYKLEDAYDEIAELRACGIRSAIAHIQNLEYDMSKKCDYSPIETVDSRVKTFRSAINKCNLRGWEPCVETFEKMHDIAGIRIVTPFLDDVWKIKDALLIRDTLKVVEEKDYINHPKTSGYRSLHLICDTRTALSEDYSWNIVEIQIRTILQHAWCSLEHKLRYKKQDLTNGIAFEWAQLGDLFYEKDQQMVRLRDQNRMRGITGAETLASAGLPIITK